MKPSKLFGLFLPIFLVANLNFGICQQNYFGLSFNDVQKKMLEYKSEFKSEPEIGFKEGVGNFIIYYLEDGISPSFFFENDVCYFEIEHYSKNKYYPKLLKILNENFVKEGEIWLEYKKNYFVVWELILEDNYVIKRGTMNKY